MKVSSDVSPTPFWIWAAKAINGATDHRAKVTRFGWLRPRRVSAM